MLFTFIQVLESNFSRRKFDWKKKNLNIQILPLFIGRLVQLFDFWIFWPWNAFTLDTPWMADDGPVCRGTRDTIAGRGRLVFNEIFLTFQSIEAAH